MTTKKDKERTEEKICAGAAETIVLGGVGYQLAPASLNASDEWQEHYFRTIKPIVETIMASRSEEEIVPYEKLFETLTLVTPKIVAELVFKYWPGLPEAKIRETASREEITEAFKVVCLMELGPTRAALPIMMGAAT